MKLYLCVFLAVYREGDHFGLLAFGNEDDSLRTADQRKLQVP